MEIVWQLATEEDGGPFRFGVTLACLHHQGNYPDKHAAETLADWGIRIQPTIALVSVIRGD